MSDELDPITPDGALSYYLDTRRYDLAESTLSGQKYRLESFIRWLKSPDHGDGEVTNMNDVDLRTVHAYRVFKREENWDDEKPCNSVTMQGQVSTIRKFLEFIADIDAVSPNLAERVRLPVLHDGEDVDDALLDPEQAQSILDHLYDWEYATAGHVTMLILWRTSCRLGGLRALDVGDFDRDEQAICFRHRPKSDTPLKNQGKAERDVSLKPQAAEVIEDYIDGPNRHRVTDEHDRAPLLTTKYGRPSKTTIRMWVYKKTRPCVVGDGCPADRSISECDATQHQLASTCPCNVSPHAVRAGSITAFRDAGTPREVVSDRGDVSEKILEKHYDQASTRQRMRRRKEHIPDNL